MAFIHQCDASSIGSNDAISVIGELGLVVRQFSACYLRKLAELVPLVGSIADWLLECVEEWFGWLVVEVDVGEEVEVVALTFGGEGNEFGVG